VSSETALARIVAALQAWRLRGLFNVVDLASGWKIDLILRRDRAFSRCEFERRQRARILDADVFVATAEDTILAKLEWARLGESERQLRDVVGVIEACGASLDRAYIERWARASSVSTPSGSAPPPMRHADRCRPPW
jgi:hypothetical protein